MRLEVGGTDLVTGVGSVKLARMLMQMSRGTPILCFMLRCCKILIRVAGAPQCNRKYAHLVLVYVADNQLVIIQTDGFRHLPGP